LKVKEYLLRFFKVTKDQKQIIYKLYKNNISMSY